MAQVTKSLTPKGPSRAELVDRAHGLAPAFRGRASRCEEARRLIDENESDLHDAGLFRILQPARVGGAELDIGALVEVGAAVAAGCASTAWNLCNLGSHHWLLGMMEPAAQAEIWDDNPDALIASSLVMPAGRGRKVDGGYMISGHWPFSSGVDNSDWNMLGAIIRGETEADPTDKRVCVLHKSQYTIVDNWHTVGLRGTGSKDVTAEDVFVPVHRTISLDDLKGAPTPGSAVNPGPLYRLPVLSLMAHVLVGAALGAARGAWRDYVDMTKTRVAKYSQVKVADYQTTQVKVAESASMIDAAELVVLNDCAEVMAYAARAAIPDLETKTRYRRNGAYAANLCRTSVDRLFDATGASGVYDLNPTQRAFRDVHVVNSHIAFHADLASSMYGRVVLDLPLGDSSI